MRKSIIAGLMIAAVAGVFILARMPKADHPGAANIVWPLGTPDLIVSLSRPVTIKPHDRDEFRNLVLPTGLTETRFVRAVDIRPGDPRVVHHAVLKIDATPNARRLDQADPGPGFAGMDMGQSAPPEGHFLVWTPGKEPLAGSDDESWPLAKGSDFVLQLHLPASDSAARLAPLVALYFSATPPRFIQASVFLNSSSIDIPPGDADYVVTDDMVLPVDVEVLSAFPHAHYLGRSMEVEAQLPDGGVTRLLRIPQWHFGRQLEYRLDPAVELPAGSRVSMRYHYDNSEDNPLNPHQPPRRVRFGQQSSDEMASLRLQVRLKSPEDRIRLAEAQARHTMIEAPDSPVLHYELGTSLLHQGRLDEAISHLNWAAEKRPEDPWAWNNLGVALAQRGRLDEAVSAWRRVLGLDPDHVEVYNNLGNVFLAGNNPERAVDYYREAVRRAPDNAVFQRNLGAGLARAGDRGGAIEAYRRAIELNPNRADWRASLESLVAGDDLDGN